MEATDFKVEVVAIDEILPHPNADRLQLARVKGWQCVIPKDKYKAGDKAVYIPVDSILPAKLETMLFPPESKIKLNKSRVKAIKIRQFISQGMVESCEAVGLFAPACPIGTDVTKQLEIVKYEPPVPEFQKGQSSPASKKKQNPHFHVYTKFPRLQNYPTMFSPEEEVIAREKVHGTNFRAGWVPFVANTLWRKLLTLIRLAPKWQFVYGSHYVQLSEKLLYDGFYDKNVYAEIVKKYDLETIIPQGDVIYGEIYGFGIQKGYDYGLKDERKLVLFDIKRNDKYIDEDQLQVCSTLYNIPLPPVLYRGKAKDCNLDQLAQGPSVLCPEQKVREGLVVRTLKEPEGPDRKIAKVVNPEYLIGDNTDFH